MQMKGENCCHADAVTVYTALLNPTRLGVALLGCKTLFVTEPGIYTGQVALEVGPVVGTFDATVHIVEQQSPSYLRMEAKAKGFTGLVKFTMVLHLTETADVTHVAWVVDVEVPGPVASAGSRVLSGVTGLSPTSSSLHYWTRKFEILVPYEFSVRVAVSNNTLRCLRLCFVIFLVHLPRLNNRPYTYIPLSKHKTNNFHLNRISEISEVKRGKISTEAK